MMKKITSITVLFAILLTTVCAGLFIVSAENSSSIFTVYQRATEADAWETVTPASDTIDGAVNSITKAYGKVVVNADYTVSAAIDKTVNSSLNMPAMLAAGKTVAIEGNGHTVYVDNHQYPFNFGAGTFLVDSLNVKTKTSPVKVPDGMVRVYPDADVTVTNSVWEVVAGTSAKWGAACLYGSLTVGNGTKILYNGTNAGGACAIRVQNRDADTINGYQSTIKVGRVITLMNNIELKNVNGAVVEYVTDNAGAIVLKSLDTDSITVSSAVNKPATVDESLKAQVAAMEASAYAALKEAMAAKFTNINWAYVEPETEEKLWKVGDTFYAKLSEAAAAVADGGVVELTGDLAVASGETVDAHKKFTLNGNGYTLTGTGTAAALTVGAGADVTVTNLTIESEEGCTPKTTVLLNGKLTLGDKAKVLNYGSASGNSQKNGVRIETDGAELNVLTGASIQVVGTALVSDGYTSTVTIDGGSVSTIYRFYVSNGSGKTPVLNIKGGTALSTSESETFIQMWASSLTVNISGGTINYGINSDFIRNGSGVVKNGANITGGTIKKSGKTILCLPEFLQGDVCLRLPENATAANSGIAFGTKLDKKTYNEMSSTLTTIVTGTLIVPSSYLDADTSFTIEALTAKYGASGFLNIVNAGWYNHATAEADGYYSFYGSMVNVKAANYNREFAAVGYVTVTVEGIGTYTFYSEVQTGTISALAEGASGNAAQNTMLGLFRGES